MNRSSILLSLFLVVACAPDGDPDPVRHLERPVDVAFGCRGAANPTDTVGQALPTSGCAPRLDAAPILADAGPTDPDAEPVRPNAGMYGFVVESTRGSVAIVKLAGEASEFIDSDPLTPGFSGVPVGRLPVEIATSPDGCWMSTANEGSCDVGVIDVFRAVDADTDVVTRLQLTATGGKLVGAPTSIVAKPSIPTDDALTGCPLSPEGFVYVALPGCDLVAMVDLATGDVVEGVRFPASGIPEFTGTTIECSLECADPGGAAVPPMPPMPGGAPQTLAMDPDGSRLYVGLWNESAIAVIELDPAGMPTTTNKIVLEGAIGVRQLDATGEIIMGNGITGTPFRFVYVLGRDNTIHVVDVSDPQNLRECDTQIDPRYIHSETNPAVLACLPVGSFPRRMSAEGPGLRLPVGAWPSDIVVVHPVPQLDAAKDPKRLNGTFVMVSAEHPFAIPRGVVFYVNVDDEDEEDFEVGGDPAAADLALVVPHTWRDATKRSAALPEMCAVSNLPRAEGPPRVHVAPGWTDTPVRVVTNVNARPDEAAGVFDFHEQRLVPSLHRNICTWIDENSMEQEERLWSLAANSPPLARERFFPDTVSTANEDWAVSWEGLLAGRLGGTFEVGPSRITLTDPAGLFCEAGLELYDQVAIGGCSNNFDCAVDEVCVVHPEKPPGVSAVCVPVGHELEYLSNCRQFMISARIYNAVAVKQDEIELVSAPFVIPYTPIDGCTDDAQCVMLGQKHLEDTQHDPSRMPALTERDLLTYSRPVCATDPAFQGIRKCVLQCDSDSDCVLANSDGEFLQSLGTVCQGGRCVFGPHGPAACMAGVKPYNLTAGNSFVVSGSASGYTHSWIEGMNKECIINPLAHPLANGRIRFNAPMCLDDDPLNFSPNICQVDLSEPVQTCNSRSMTTDDCEVDPMNPDPWSSSDRISHGMRVITAGVTFEIADIYMDSPFTPGDRLMPAPSRYRLTIPLAGGYFERFNSSVAWVPSRIRMSPNGHPYVVDSGDAGGAGGTQGKIVELRFVPDIQTDSIVVFSVN